MTRPPRSDEPMPLWRHLEDLRHSLLWSIVGIVVAMIVAWFFREPLLHFLVRPLSVYLPEGQRLTVLKVTEAFLFYVKLSFFAALFLASPWVFYQLWRFVAPGLYRHERHAVIGFVFATTACFLIGGWFGYAYIVPLTVRFLLEMSKEFQVMITTTYYFSFFLHLILGVALVFELPVLCFLLARMGLLTARTMLRFWKYAVVGSFILSAVITPSGDMITQSVLAIPLVGLYFFSILVVTLGQRRRGRASREITSTTS